MKTLTVAKLKSEFSLVVADLKKGNEVAITFGRKKELIGTIVPQSRLAKPNHAIKLGDLKKKGWSYKLKDFEISPEELVSF